MSLDSLAGLLTGKTLHELESVRNQVADDLDKAKAVAEQLRDGSSEEVIKALRHILNSGDAVVEEYPALGRFIEMAQPNHLHAPLLRAALLADVPVWLYGEAGSGKTTAGERVANSLNLPFRSIPLGPSTSKADLMGYRDATGQYHSTGYREVYEGGGVFTFDEIDNAHPSILTILNSSIANGHGEFPDVRVARHQTARFVATANTVGRGATAEYVGRAPIDAATVDRFAFIPMDIDPDLEEALVLGRELDREPLDISAGEVPSDKEWLAIVRAHRDAVVELGIRAIISQRAALYGIRLTRQGVGKDWLGEMLLYKGMKEHDKEKVQHFAEKALHRHRARLEAEPRDGQKWFTEPEDRAMTEYEQNHLETILDSAIDELRYSSSYPDGLSDNVNTLLSLCWQLEKETGTELHSINQTHFIGVTAQNSLVEGKQFGLFAKKIEEIGDYEKLTTWQEKDDPRVDYIMARFPDLSINDVINYAQQFEEMNGFIPGRITLSYWLSQNPEVVDVSSES